MNALVQPREVCFLALTRPALTLGVPLEGLLVNVFACLLSGMVFSSHSWRNSPFMYWFLALPIHAAMRRLTSWDFHAFRTIRLWILTTGIGITALNIVATQRVRTGKGVASSG
jgi:type IV secretory pathway VirB3-like protein